MAIFKEKQRKILRTSAQTAVLMAILTLGSKVLGFAREMVMAGYFGTSYITDAYVMAQTIPTIIFSGVFVAVAMSFIPLLSKKMENEGELAGNVFTSQVINVLFIVSAISAIVGLIFSDQLTAVFARGFTGETAKLTSFLLKITLSYVVFSSIAGILEAFLQYKKIFIPQIIIGYAQNVIVMGIIVISATFSYYYLAFGLLIANALRLLLMWFISIKRGFKYTRRGQNTGGVIKNISVLALPVFLGSSVLQINIFVDKYLASGLQEGSVSALNYANLLNTMVMALSTTILTTMIYPRLAQANSAGDRVQFNELLQKGFNLTVIIALPFSLGAMAYSEQIVQIVFERGAFDVAATILTGSAYLYYSVGMLFIALNNLLTQTYYSIHDMKTPMIFAGISVIINIVCSLLFIDSMEHAGLALATSIAAFLNTLLLYYGLRRKHCEVEIIRNKKKLIVVAIMAIISVLISYIVYIAIVQIVWMPRIVYLGVAVLIAMTIYLVLLKLFKIEEVDLIREIVKRK